MLLKYFYDPALAHASYLVGCQKSGEAIVIDPGRNVQPYLDAAKANGMRIVGAAETHIHADFVSGSRELADRTGATLYLSDEGPADWKYLYVDKVNAQLLKDGDAFYVGNVKLQTMHTPGHTPEHISFVLTDEGGGATEPMGIFTGDFVFVGSIGRPDLLETAAGVVGSAEKGARQLFHSVERFRSLPDYLQLWPAHGAGSACGKGLGAIPSSTVGYEKKFNPALQYDDEQEFVDYILADQPETPFYFAVMKRVNKEGPELLSELPKVAPVDPMVIKSIAKKNLVIDITPSAQFGEAHVPGTINIPAKMMAQWAGFFVNYEEPIYLVADADSLPGCLTSLRSIGIDLVSGYFDMQAVRTAGLRDESYANATPADLQAAIDGKHAVLLDVRSETEFQQGHIPGAQHRFLGKLLRNMGDLDDSQSYIVQCQSGGRSAIAASLLQRAGLDVTNMSGGYLAWNAAEFPVLHSWSGAGI
ncbi:MBL fold metallo-hydrolase [Blastopirellula sp. JC732]|uniref:MBL fold metallo-hydrolase n=1 Tax=Blastopirellula sediminis TaxID=2894196 RepID=A0A9X1MST9_9BACT|nr:MBL fold metallo-hydrolase [Blastopirellula sediminis]MCC9604856.1 MBL fold metallo-hydrolase [Blastopirellula sediminis]MCC9631845.1 MBL fold metallo-hydrolase [Blastopirellula sediminis]